MYHALLHFALKTLRYCSIFCLVMLIKYALSDPPRVRSETVQHHQSFTSMLNSVISLHPNAILQMVYRYLCLLHWLCPLESAFNNLTVPFSLSRFVIFASCTSKLQTLCQAESIHLRPCKLRPYYPLENQSKGSHKYGAKNSRRPLCFETDCYYNYLGPRVNFSEYAGSSHS